MTRLPKLSRRAIVMLMMEGGKHPHILLTDPFKLLGRGGHEAVIVPLTTSRKHYDPTCVFHDGEDEHIREGSCVIYANAQLRKVADITAELRKHNRAVRRISQAAYIRIIEGLLQSPGTPAPIIRYFQEARRQGLAG